MIALGDTLISEDVFDTLFACDLSKCKGACCVEGESGAPLTEEEVDRLEGAFEVVKPIRLKQLQDFTALNVHQWTICDGARTCGASSNITVLEFCRTALIREFGEAWYDDALEIWKAWKNRDDAH
jgi:hypothetical protein